MLKNLKNYKLSYIPGDIFIGIIIAFISIPISMGYAMIAGLPPVYGLYGSVLPILLFGLITSSPGFVFGVDAAPAALTGALVYSLGLTAFSEEAISLIPALTICVTFWLGLFMIFRADRLTRFVSSPVMGGFISGIGCEIILMQAPKLFGGDALRGELFELVPEIIHSARTNFNLLSFILGLSTVVIILIFKKISPRIPMTVIMMIIGAFLGKFTPIADHGVRLLDTPKPGLMHLTFPDLTWLFSHPKEMITTSLVIAIVVTAETLLATQNFAMKNGQQINGRQELLAYTAGMFGAALSGCCPVNGSVSRSGIADQYKVRSQIMSLVASITMVLILLVGTPFIGWLPVPILTAIVISALIGILEISLAVKLYKADRIEFFIFMAVLMTVLILGTVYGVFAGVILSFVIYIIRASKPARSFLGCIPGQEGFFPIDRYKDVRPIKGVVIYRFMSPLFFANAGILTSDLEKAVGNGTKVVIVDAGSISSIDITAAEYILKLYENFKKKGIRFFLTEHDGKINDELHEFGCGVLLSEWAVLPRIEQALKICGYSYPYIYERNADDITRELQNEIAESNLQSSESDLQSGNARRVLAQFEWAFGKDAENRMQELAIDFSRKLLESEWGEKDHILNELIPSWGILDEEQFLDIVEMQLAVYDTEHSTTHIDNSDKYGIQNNDQSGTSTDTESDKDDDPANNIENIKEALVRYHADLDRRLAESDSTLINDVVRARRRRELYFKKHNPKAYEIYRAERHEHRNLLREKYPKLLAKIDEIRADEDSKHK